MDQRKVGRVAWMVLHSLSEILDRSSRPKTMKCKIIHDLMMCMSQVFPCKKCRDGIRMTWQKPGGGCDVKGSMFWFHSLVSHKVAANQGKSEPVQSIESARSQYEKKYVRLVDTQAWRVYLVSFVYAVTTNCTKMCETLISEGHGNREKAHINFENRLMNFLRVVKAIDPSIPMPRFKKDSDCNQIFYGAYDWEKQLLDRNMFGKPNETRERHLCARVNSKHYVLERFPGNLCGKKSCHGACEKCDKVAIQMIHQEKK